MYFASNIKQKYHLFGIDGSVHTSAFLEDVHSIIISQHLVCDNYEWSLCDGK